MASWCTTVLFTILLALMKEKSIATVTIQQPDTRNPANFDATFTGALPNYLRYTDVPAIGSFTICWWMKQDFGGMSFFIQNLLTLSTRDNAIEITSRGATFGNTGGIVLSIASAQAGYTGFNIKDNQFHHVCLEWDNQKREMAGFVDGSIKASTTTTEIPQGLVIVKGGCLVAGWGQSAYCGALGGSPYTGILSQLNIWSRGITTAEVKDLYRGCTTHHGDLFKWNWPLLENSFNGTQIMSPTRTCQDDYASGIFLTYPQKTLKNHVIASRLVPDVTSCTSICLRYGNCQSFNILKSSGLYICQLNSYHGDIDDAELVYDEDSVYYYRSQYWNG